MNLPTSIKRGEHEILFDAEDAPRVLAHSWTVHRSNGCFYARALIKGNYVKLHNFILSRRFVDHKDSNGLNNRRDNLRPYSGGQNCWNARKLAKATSRFKGVTRVKNRQHSFEVSCTANGKRVKLGRFFDEVAAALAYDITAVNLHGEFARPNFSIVEAALVHPASLKLAIERCQKKGLPPADLKEAA